MSSKKEREWVIVDSDRDALMDCAVDMFEAMQRLRQSVADSSYAKDFDQTPEEREAYASAMKYLTQEFRNGSTEITKHLITKTETEGEDNDD